jgi:hypothetical protein
MGPLPILISLLLPSFHEVNGFALPYAFAIMFCSPQAN